MEKVQNGQKCNSTENFFDLFDFTSFFAWTFLNFLDRCDATVDQFELKKGAKQLTY